MMREARCEDPRSARNTGVNDMNQKSESAELVGNLAEEGGVRTDWEGGEWSQG